MEYNYQNSIDDFRVEYTLVMKEETSSGYQFTEKESTFLKELEAVYDDIERLTNQASGYDYAVAISCGIITGLIDSFFVGSWDFRNAKKQSNIAINHKIIDFAKKDPRYIPWCRETGKTNQRKQRDPKSLESAVEFLEEKYKLPGDNDWKNFKGSTISALSHHLDDFCHHPTLVGMICCIMVQFTGTTKYYSSKGTVISTPVIVNEYGNLLSEKTYGKIFAGIINWFFKAAQTLQNREGHLMSDMAGSIKTVKKKRAGAGLPGTIVSILKELSALPCLNDPLFSDNLRKAYQNGIGNTGNKLDLGILNNLFEGAVSKFDIRTEMAVGYELKGQARPVLINEIVVRAFYFIRRFIEQMRVKRSLMDLEWKKLFPANNRTIARMMTVASGVFCVVDLGDAAIRASIKSNGQPPIFLNEFILRVNFVGVGRFTIAIGTDLYMEARKSRLQIAVASGEVGATAISMKHMIIEMSKTNSEMDKKLDRMKSMPNNRNMCKFSGGKKTMEFDADALSEEELIKVAENIFSVQEKDFEKIKSEKWYQTFFHAITLNQDGKKITVNGVRSLAKLQQLFISIYARYYQKTYQVLDNIIKKVIENNEKINQLYETIVLNFEEQGTLKDLTPDDAKILALFLGAYRDKDGHLPDKVKEYNRAVWMSLNQQMPSGNLENHQLRKLNSPKVIYRCFLEQCAIDGALDSQVWPDDTKKLLEDIDLGKTTKSEILKAVEQEINTFGVDYLILKYNKENDEFQNEDFIVDVNTKDEDYKNFSPENDYENATLGTGNDINNGANRKKESSGLNVDHAEKYVKILKILHEGGKQRNAVLNVINRESNFNIKVPTIGGSTFWTNIVKYKGWRLQQNNITHHVRILDPHNVRVAWGTIGDMYKALDRLLESF